MYVTKFIIPCYAVDKDLQTLVALEPFCVKNGVWLSGMVASGDIYYIFWHVWKWANKKA